MYVSLAFSSVCNCGTFDLDRAGRLKFYLMRAAKWEAEIDMNGHLIVAAARLFSELRGEDR